MGNAHRQHGAQVNALEPFAGHDPCDDDLSAAVFMARGNEPFWRLDVTPRQLRLQRPDEQPTVAEYAPLAPAGDPSVRHYQGQATAGPLALDIKREACSDGMSDMLYAWTATATLANDFRGCATPHRYAATMTRRGAGSRIS